MRDYAMFAVNEHPDAVVVTIKEPHISTLITAEMLQSDLLSLIREERPQVLVLNFEHVRMISSSAVSVLLLARKQLDEYGGQLRLCHVCVPVAEIYRVLNLENSRLLVFDSVEQALAARVIESDRVREIWED